MSKFSEFLSQGTADERPKGVIIDGTFGCQHCFEHVDEAEYFINERLLKWKCSEGHVSYIEGFAL